MIIINLSIEMKTSTFEMKTYNTAAAFTLAQTFNRILQIFAES